MSDMDAYLGNKILRYLAGFGMPTPPTQLWLALFDGDPRTGGTEVTTQVESTGRQKIELEEVAEGYANEAANLNLIDFGNAENQVSVSHIAVFDHQSNQVNRLFTKELVGGPFTVELNSPVRFQIGDLIFIIGTPGDIS